MFVANKNSKFAIYQKIHEFFNLEEVNQPIAQIYSNIKSIDFYDLKPLSHKISRNFSRLDCFLPQSYFVKNIIFPKNLFVFNYDKFLLNLSTLKLKLKIIMEAEV